MFLTTQHQGAKEEETRDTETGDPARLLPRLLSDGQIKFASFKVTIQPDWICMRVVSLDRPWKRTSTAIDFQFLIFEKRSKF